MKRITSKADMINMKYFIASDIHGSLYYLKQMLRCYKAERADRLVLLGDILYHGPRNDLPRDYNPKEVIKLLNEMKDDILAVRGNCDTEVDQMVLDFPILSEYAVISENGKTLYLTHGHKFNKDNPPPLKNGDYLLNGHFHIPEFTECENFTYINVGSVSIPKGNSAHSYVLFENGEFTFKEI